MALTLNLTLTPIMALSSTATLTLLVTPFKALALTLSPALTPIMALSLASTLTLLGTPYMALTLNPSIALSLAATLGAKAHHLGLGLGLGYKGPPLITQLSAARASISDTYTGPPPHPDPNCIADPNSEPSPNPGSRR